MWKRNGDVSTVVYTKQHGIYRQKNYSVEFLNNGDHVFIDHSEIDDGMVRKFTIEDSLGTRRVLGAGTYLSEVIGDKKRGDKTVRPMNIGEIDDFEAEFGNMLEDFAVKYFNVPLISIHSRAAKQKLHKFCKRKRGIMKSDLAQYAIVAREKNGKDWLKYYSEDE